MSIEIEPGDVVEIDVGGHRALVVRTTPVQGRGDVVVEVENQYGDTLGRTSVNPSVTTSLKRVLMDARAIDLTNGLSITASFTFRGAGVVDVTFSGFKEPTRSLALVDGNGRVLYEFYNPHTLIPGDTWETGIEVTE